MRKGHLSFVFVNGFLFCFVLLFSFSFCLFDSISKPYEYAYACKNCGWHLVYWFVTMYNMYIVHTLSELYLMNMIRTFSFPSFDGNIVPHWKRNSDNPLIKWTYVLWHICSIDVNGQIETKIDNFNFISIRPFTQCEHNVSQTIYSFYTCSLTKCNSISKLTPPTTNCSCHILYDIQFFH